MPARSGHLAALLDGEMPPGVADDLAAAKIDLLPVAGEVQPRGHALTGRSPASIRRPSATWLRTPWTRIRFSVSMRGRERDSLLVGLRARRAEAGGGVAGRARGQQGRRATAGFDSGHATTWPTDVNNALDPWAWSGVGVDRWFSASAGNPVATVQTREADRIGAASPSGFGAHLNVASTTGERRCATCLGAGARGPELGPQLSMGEDLARRRPRCSARAASREKLSSSPRWQACRRVTSSARRWRGGTAGVRVSSFCSRAGTRRVTNGRAGGRCSVERQACRRNRATLGELQLRLGRDGRWYPFRRSGRGAASGVWVPDGAPIEDDV